jgi:integrase
MILVAYRHGFRASGLTDLSWDQIDFDTATMAVQRAKRRTPSTHPIFGHNRPFTFLIGKLRDNCESSEEGEPGGTHATGLGDQLCLVGSHGLLGHQSRAIRLPR